MMTLSAVGLRQLTEMKDPDHPTEVTGVEELKELIEPTVAMQPILFPPA